MRLTKLQQSVAQAALDTTVFVSGMAGVGKTTAAVRRLRYLIEQGVPAGSILILVPQKALAYPYQAELRDPKRKAGGQVAIHTIGSLALHMADLFWPLAAEAAGYGRPDQRPTFLSLELVQYSMAKLLGPVIDANDYFNSVRIDRYRLYSQIADNLNKATFISLPHTEIADRLKSALPGSDVTQRYIYDDAQTCANLFRDFSRQHNLLDFAAQVELLVEYLWTMDAPRRYLVNRFRHLIIDNIEEDNPATHYLLENWLALCQSAVVVYDDDAGYRRFLGAEQTTALRLKDRCKQHVEIDKSYVMSDEVRAFGQQMTAALRPPPPKRLKDGGARQAIIFQDNRYYPQMLNWAAENITSMVLDGGVPPGEIVVLAPLLSDALRFALMNRLEAAGVPVRSHRPSRALREEPAARALLTLARLAHPAWELKPDSYDVTYALMAAIADLDLTRARLLTEIVYRPRSGKLFSFEPVRGDAQSRITYDLGMRYETLFRWLETYQQEGTLELDFFFSRLFGEVLSQPRYGFHNQYDAAAVAANLIESARNFRWTVAAIAPEVEVGREYLLMVDQGLIADQYIRDWELDRGDAVLLAPAYTYLMSNRPVDYQFWLNIGSPGWAQRLYQPLTHPYVLSVNWEDGRVWTDDDEVTANQDMLYRLALGLIRRCRQRVYLGFSQFGEQGYEQRGPLLEAIQRILKHLQQD